MVFSVNAGALPFSCWKCTPENDSTSFRHDDFSYESGSEWHNTVTKTESVSEFVAAIDHVGGVRQSGAVS